MDTNLTESLQLMIARSVATHPAGAGLALVGGFRYRLLDRSVRFSADIDYHWPGELVRKQQELAALFRRVVLPEAKRSLRMDGTVSEGGESPFVSTVTCAFFRADVPHSRIEIPVDITRIVCLDPPVARPGSGVVYLTASDLDMVEAKALSVFLRAHPAQRDILDVYLFQDAFRPDSPSRLQQKLRTLNVAPDEISRAMSSLEGNARVHVKALGLLLDTQVEEGARSAMMAGGGPEAIFSAVVALLHRHFGIPGAAGDEDN